jgi:glutamate 5-kinase
VRRAVVVKLGSSTLVDARGRIRRSRLGRLAAEVMALRAGGTPVCVVSSGAIALGLGSLRRDRRPPDLPGLQAASAVGQGLLVAAWRQALARHGGRSGQVLLTAADLHARTGYLNARATLERLLRWEVVPIVNENDSVATDEITFGDNDALAAQVAVLLRARLLVLLTEADGLFTRHPAEPGAELVREVHDHGLLAELDTAGESSSWGTGGMRSKVVAAEMASASGIACVIGSGVTPGVLADAVAGRAVGTRFAADPRPVDAYRLWLRHGKPASGRLVVDDGARLALERDGASLLPVGITAVEGRFNAGDAVLVVGRDGTAIAKGLAAADAATLRRAAGRRSPEAGMVEAVHRDDMAVLRAPF